MVSITTSPAILQSITLPNSLTTIKNYAFNKCTSLKSVVVPGSVTQNTRGTRHNRLCRFRKLSRLAFGGYACLADSHHGTSILR
ncbi:MAG: leucine-rich repeat domain-containing protein [Paludibacteraceae bacterium]|nr:leucine-rich repeat domain-containing protein [Paludibacteraceae bacterium]